MLLISHLIIALVLPILMVGIINRTKAVWAGRRGLPLNQLYFELRRLLRKHPVYSKTTTWVFQLSPWAVLTSVLLAIPMTPWIPGYAPVSFAYDFVVVAYLLAFGRVFLILGAMDTGSSFEGMGASREATYSALMEPAFLFAMGTLALASGNTSFQDLFLNLPASALGLVFRVGLFACLFIFLQIEAARVPVDDPNTHLELTMIHEVMVLDHSGPELAAIQYAAAVKMTLLAGLLACVVNPFNAHEAPQAALWFGGFAFVGISVLIGLIESLIARLRLRTIPAYAFTAFSASLISLMALVWHWRAVA